MCALAHNDLDFDMQKEPSEDGSFMFMYKAGDHRNRFISTEEIRFTAARAPMGAQTVSIFL